MEARKALKKGIRKAKHKSWRAFTESVSDAKTTARLLKCIQKCQNESIGIMSDAQNDRPEETVNHLLNVHFPGNTTVEEGEQEGGNTFFGKFRYAQITISWITTNKIKWAISNFGNHKAAGPDGLAPMVLKQPSDRVLEHLRVIYVSSIYSGYVLRSWSKSRVIFVPKPGKGDYTEAKSFCPITLSSFIFKALERVVLVHLEETYDVYNKLNMNQHAFRKGSSCDSALSDMVDELESTVFRRQYTLGIFLDIKGAFDNQTVEASIRGMNKTGLPPDIVRWHPHYLKHRTMEISLKGIHCP